MFDFSASPERPRPEVGSVIPAPATAKPEPQPIAQKSSTESSVAGTSGAPGGGGEATQGRGARDSLFLHVPGAISGADEVALGEEVYLDLHSLEAVRVAIGFVETHLSDLMWFQDRLVEHHGNLVRTRNLSQKALEGIARAIYMRDRQDEMHDATAELGGGRMEGRAN